MLSLGFLNPWMLWGLSAAAIPIVIHILNRRRFQRVRWAAIEYLLAALKENRKRIQLEQLLLLLLRTAVALLFALLLARPLSEGAEMFGLFRGRTHHLLLVDDSGSLGQKSGTTDLLRTAGKTAEEMVSRLRERRPDDLVTLIRASAPDRPDILGERPTQALQLRIQELFKPLTPFPDRLPMAPMIAAAHKRAQELKDANEARVHVITDLRRNDWLTDEEQPVHDVTTALRLFDVDRSRFYFHPLGGDDTDNVGIVAIQRREAQAVAEVPVTLDVEVANQGLTPTSEGAELILEIDGGTRLTRPLPALDSGQRAVVSFPHTFREPGSHTAVAILPPDRFALDDRRALVLPVRDRTRALVVEGETGERLEDTGGFFLSLALDPGGGEVVSGVSVETIADHLLKERELNDVDLLVLSNVGTLTEELAAKIETYVRAGGGLLLFLGNQIDPAAYNNLLYRKGEGLLPAALVGIQGDTDKPKAMVVAAIDHDTVRKSLDGLKVFLGSVDVGRWFTVAADPAAGGGKDEGKTPGATTVVLRIDNEEGPPAVLTRSFGAGKVLLFTLPANRSWSMWPRNPSYLLYLQQAHEFAMRHEPLSPWNVSPRTPWTWSFPASLYTPEVALRWLGDGDEGEERSLAAVPDEKSADLLRIAVGDHRRPGVWRATLRPRSGAPENLHFSVNPDPKEGQLARTSESVLRRVYPKELMERATFVEQTATQSAGFLTNEGELWKPIAIVVLIFLLLETLLAWRFGRG